MYYKEQVRKWRLILVASTIAAPVLWIATLIEGLGSALNKAVTDGANQLCAYETGKCNTPTPYKDSFFSFYFLGYVVVVLLALVAVVLLEINKAGKRHGENIVLPEILQSKAQFVGLLKASIWFCVYVSMASLILLRDSTVILLIGLLGFVVFLTWSIIASRKFRKFEKTLQTE